MSYSTSINKCYHTPQNEPCELCEMQMCDPTGNLTFVYRTNKSWHVFLNSEKNASFSPASPVQRVWQHFS